jgi:hypothetical protein
MGTGPQLAVTNPTGIVALFLLPRGRTVVTDPDERSTAMVGFVLGALAGGLAVWYWQDQIRIYADRKTRGVRNGAADTLRAVEKRAEDVLDRTKGQLSSALQAGQDAIRPRTR